MGGRYSALTAFGLVPSGLAGADIGRLLDEAEAVSDLLADDDEANPGLRLGAAMAGTEPLRNKLVLVDQGSGLSGFADWAEQLIAESTGKQGTGSCRSSCPTTPPPRSPAPARRHRGAPRRRRGHLRRDGARRPRRDRQRRLGHRPARRADAAVGGRDRRRRPDPRDQPVRPARRGERQERRPRRCSRAARTARLPRSPTAPSRSARSAATGSATPRTLTDAVAALLAQVDGQQGYVAVMAYLDRLDQAELAEVRNTLAHRVRRPVTFGWGPRFLHSTGQFHKGGPAEGVYLQITAEPEAEDLAVPGKDVHLRHG